MASVVSRSTAAWSGTAPEIMIGRRRRWRRRAPGCRPAARRSRRVEPAPAAPWSPPSSAPQVVGAAVVPEPSSSGPAVVRRSVGRLAGVGLGRRRRVVVVGRRRRGVSAAAASAAEVVLSPGDLPPSSSLPPILGFTRNQPAATIARTPDHRGNDADRRATARPVVVLVVHFHALPDPQGRSRYMKPARRLDNCRATGSYRAPRWASTAPNVRRTMRRSWASDQLST